MMIPKTHNPIPTKIIRKFNVPNVKMEPKNPKSATITPYDLFSIICLKTFAIEKTEKIPNPSDAKSIKPLNFDSQFSFTESNKNESPGTGSPNFNAIAIEIPKVIEKKKILPRPTFLLTLEFFRKITALELDFADYFQK